MSSWPVGALALLALALDGGALVARDAAAPSDLSLDEKERFLLEAEILQIREVGIGVTGSKRATLSDGRMIHDAHVQNVDIYDPKFTAGKAYEVNFRDFWGFNIAAYRLDRLLGLGMVPPSVERKVRGRRSSVTWWVDGVLMSAAEYRRSGRKPPDPTDFDRQRRQGWAFQQLVLNRDPNLGNLLVDEDWNAWMIDFTRAFRTWKKLDDVKPLTQVRRSFYDGLHALDPHDVERELGPYLKKAELKGLLARRNLLLEHYDKQIEKRGEASVLTD